MKGIKELHALKSHEESKELVVIRTINRGASYVGSTSGISKPGKKAWS